MALTSAVLKGAAAPIRAASAARRIMAVAAPRAFPSSFKHTITRMGGAVRAASRQERAARLSTRAAAAEAGTETAAVGDYVEVHYTGTLDSGEVFDSSRERDPLAFRVGSGRMIAGFDKAVTGLAVGGSRKQRVEAGDAYGEWREEMTAKVPKSSAPDGLQEGMVVRLQNGMEARVTSVTDDEIKIDANHPLAGKTLNFDVELVKLVKASALKRALFGAGCFWGPELAFQRVPGVLETSVGYAQGSVENPTYEQVCSGQTGHTEVVEVVYDPSQVSFDAILEVFWDKHDPTQLNRQGNDVGTQYRSGIYYTSEEQKAAAEASMAKLNQKLGGQVVTELEEAQKFWPAEDYHQQYLEKGGRFGRPQSARKGCNDPIRCYG